MSTNVSGRRATPAAPRDGDAVARGTVSQDAVSGEAAPARVGARKLRPLTVLRDARLLLMALWLGGAAFFSFVVAPGAFAVLPARELAGAVVNRTLAVLNTGGFVIGALLLASAFVGRETSRRGALLLEVLSLAVITLASAAGQWIVGARMRALRSQMGRPVDELAQSDPLRLSFNYLLGYSVLLLTAAMLAGVVALLAIARSGRRA